MPKKITSKQETRIGDLVIAALRTLELSLDDAQEIIKAGGVLQEEIKPILLKLAMAGQRFGPAINNFEFTVLSNYEHDTQLDTFAEKTRNLKTTYYFNDDLTSANFAKATNKLEPGKAYRVQIFPVLETVTSEDCMAFLKKQGAILVGAQGITLLQANKLDEFPVDKYTVSFDQKDALWTDAVGDRRVPYVRRRSGGDWSFSLGYFGQPLSGDDCLLCVCDK